MAVAFTAFQLARCLGISPQAVRKALSRSPSILASPSAKNGFQETRSWTLDALPDSMRSRLVSLSLKAGHRSVTDFIFNGASRFVCSIPLEKLSQQALQNALNLKANLAPILRQAEGLSIHEMAQRAHLAIARSEHLKLESPRTLRRRIERILIRAGGIADFDNLDIYAEEFAHQLAEETPKIERQTECPRTLFAAQEYAPLQHDLSLAQIFAAAREDYEELQRKIGQRKAKAVLLDFLAACGVPIAETRNALRKRIDAVFARMDAGLAGIDLIKPPTIHKRGRKPLAKLEGAELQAARALYMQTGSATAALRMLASTAECSEETASAILKRRSSKHTITPTLRAQLTSMPGAVADWHKSPSRVKREAFINPRTLTFLDQTGTEQRILPGMLAERDDMSNNFIFWIDWPWGGDPCSDKYGVRIARGQNLLHLDVGSLKFLSFLMLVRLRDSYRADDIWQWVGQTYRDIGMPEIGERWERGIWQANKLQGTPIESGHTDQKVRLGGIQALGRKIIVSQSPTTKIIENRFRYFQRVCSTIPGQIGASRGEMEKVNKLWTACRDGRRDPRDYFLKFEDACAQIEAKIQFVNAEEVEGAIYDGIPNEIWQRENGASRMKRLAAEQTYLFSRDRSIVTVNKGHALIRRKADDGTRRAWYFHHPDLWRHDGEQVALYYDRYAAESGATIVHADRKRAGQVIGHATLVEGCPQFALGLDFEGRRGAEAAMQGLERRKDFSNAVRAEYRAIGLTHTIARGTYVSDGMGRSGQVEKSEPVVTPDSFSRTKADEVLKRSRMEREEIDLEKIEAMEREALTRGELIPI